MKYYAAVAALIAAVEAVSLGNTDYDKIEAGKPYTIEWYSAAGAVSIELRYGKFDDLQSLETILSSYSNGETGSFVWPVPDTLPQEGPYAFVISDDNGVNYSPQFDIQGVSVSESKPSDTAAPSTTKAATTKSSVTAAALMPDQTSSSFEFQSTSSLPFSAPTAHTSSTLAKTTTSVSSKTSSAPSTVASPPDGEGKAPGMASPLALILVSVAAMFYLQ